MATEYQTTADKATGVAPMALVEGSPAYVTPIMAQIYLCVGLRYLNDVRYWSLSRGGDRRCNANHHLLIRCLILGCCQHFSFLVR